MSDKLPPSIFPARFQILSGSMLKLLACIAMLIDHTGAIILSHYPPALTELFYINGKGITFYRIVRDIGRCAFPIFCSSKDSFIRMTAENMAGICCCLR